LNIGWQRPPGPRHHPAPQRSATVTTGPSAVWRCTGKTPALAAVARPSANVVASKSDFVMVFSLGVMRAEDIG
jgi:hypothetical protein